MPVILINGSFATAAICSWLCACNLSSVPSGTDTLPNSSVSLFNRNVPRLSRNLLNTSTRAIGSLVAPLSEYTAPAIGACNAADMSVLRTGVLKFVTRSETASRSRIQKLTHSCAIWVRESPPNIYAGFNISGISRPTNVSNRVALISLPMTYHDCGL